MDMYWGMVNELENIRIKGNEYEYTFDSCGGVLVRGIISISRMFESLHFVYKYHPREKDSSEEGYFLIKAGKIIKERIGRIGQKEV